MCPSASEATRAASPDADPVVAARAKLQRGDFAGCQTVLRNLGEAAGSEEALYIDAVCRRYLKDYAGARSVLDRLLGLAPDNARAYQERGHVADAEGDGAVAAEAYQRAVALNPALAASWKALARLRAAAGDERGRADALAQLRRLESLPPELVSVTSFLHQNRLLKAEKLCRAFLSKNPRHVEAMRLLAAIGTRLNVLDDAEFLLESALAFQPDYLPARVDYVTVLQKRQKFGKALDEARAIRAAHPDSPALEAMYAHALAAAGRFDEAIGIFDERIRQDPADVSLRMARGHALKTTGRQDAAIESYRGALAVRSELGDACWSLANLKTYRFTDDELERMLALSQREDLADDDRVPLCFALGKACEDRRDYERSFAFYERGNRLKKAVVGYDGDRMSRQLARQREFFTHDFFAERAGRGCPDRDPIFIVGLPRAGSTLLEQILASHSQVDGTLELPNVLALVRRLQGRRRVDDAPRYPGVLESLDASKLRAFGEQYLADTKIHRAGAPHFTDKMPNNFRHIGLIHLMLPNAKIIDARRDPMACCFSGFKQLFAEGQEFTYGLDEIARYYRDYVELMQHWDRVLPGRILRVMHQDVVEDLEGQVRRLLGFCGLPFEAQCLEFHRTKRSVRTASSEQVRQPINRRGLEQWRAFEPWLGPLKHALGPLAAGSEAAP